jgi:phosphoribosylformimino-5-aminoimidazole carboxamide ribotide isomerase
MAKGPCMNKKHNFPFESLRSGMRFRPCIDLHQGKVKQIVGGTLSDENAADLETNFEAQKPARWFANLYRRDKLTGGHIIQLGPGNENAARDALKAWPGGLQLGGAVTAENAGDWIDAGAAAVIVTSWVFHDGRIDQERLERLSQSVGPEKLVLDLSCRRRDDGYYIVTNRWQTFTREKISPHLLDRLSRYCFEYLIHAVDVEGRCQGIETDLVALLARWDGVPVTYAGGIRSLEDIRTIDHLGRGRIDFTVGSALDIFGGQGLRYAELVECFGAE